MSASAALMVAAGLAGCGSTTYFAGHVLPPSGLTNRVMIAIQNPSVFTKGALQIVDAYYDTRSGYTGQPASFSISGFGGALPISIQNMPEQQIGEVYGSGDGSMTTANYAGEKTAGTVSGLNGLSSSIFMTRNGTYVFAASQQSHVLTVVDQSKGGSYPLSLPGVYRVSVNPGGTVAMAFVQNSNYAYYPRELTTAQSLSYAGGPSKWPKAAVDCEPQNAPGWCLFQAQSPDAVDATGNYYGAPLVFDRPVKAVFSADGSTAYVLNCGPECGGTTASISLLPVAPMIFETGQASGLLPCNSAPCTNAQTHQIANIAIPGGASNALVATSTMYVVGQRLMPDGYFGGFLTVLNLANNTVVPSTSSSPNPVSISDGMPGAVSRMLQADDNTLWIGMTKCNQGERFYNNQPYGCLTMYNTSTNKVVLLEPYTGDATGIAAVTGLHKIYSAQGGQVYIHSTVDGTAIDNQFVTVTGTAYDVAYIDGVTDANNTVY
ncbi:MAG TPA: hypothetical protein VMW15_16970 [Terracidiphilus sp.]|nr:hypothetical protein [Terracidiphilus sp.]HUX27548.1 hypothetical protein [Terracidiphilus sp.]